MHECLSVHAVSSALSCTASGPWKVTEASDRTASGGGQVDADPPAGVRIHLLRLPAGLRWRGVRQLLPHLPREPPAVVSLVEQRATLTSMGGLRRAHGSGRRDRLPRSVTLPARLPSRVPSAVWQWTGAPRRTMPPRTTRTMTSSSPAAHRDHRSCVTSTARGRWQQLRPLTSPPSFSSRRSGTSSSSSWGCLTLDGRHLSGSMSGLRDSGLELPFCELPGASSGTH